MKEEDQSFSDLMEVCSGHFKRQRPNEEEHSSGPTRFRSGQRKSSHSSGSGSVDESTLLGMLSRLTLRQEDQLNQLNLDRTFLLFIQAGKSSILPQLLQTSKTWHGQREQGKVDRPLRQLMFQSVFEELASRAAQLPLGSSDHELILALRSKKILTSTNAWNYLQWDHQEKALKPSTRDPISSGSFQDDRTHPYDCQPTGTHSPVHGTETDAIGSAGSLLQCRDPMETRHLPPECGQPGTVRPSDEAHGQWPDTIDRHSPTTLDLATVAIGPGSGPDSQKMRTLILELSLGNDANDCFMNTALLGELWACCMDNTFSWELLGTWQPKLIQLLERGPNTQWLTDSGCLGSLLDGWFAAHTMGPQQDVAEFLGWLRLAMHSQLFEAVQQAPRWEARFEATIEDWGLTCSPIVTREEKSAGCTLQELVHMWHEQPPYCLGLVGSATTVCLQINRFPALGIRSKTLISWNRQHVMMPCYMSSSGRTVNWLEYKVVAIALRRGLEPTAGHYQCLLQTGGGRFLCDDDRIAISVPHLQAMEEDAYLVWLTNSQLNRCISHRGQPTQSFRATLSCLDASAARACSP